jgi:hypothetical protein
MTKSKTTTMDINVNLILDDLWATVSGAKEPTLAITVIILLVLLLSVIILFVVREFYFRARIRSLKSGEAFKKQEKELEIFRTELVSLLGAAGSMDIYRVELKNRLKEAEAEGDKVRTGILYRVAQGFNKASECVIGAEQMFRTLLIKLAKNDIKNVKLLKQTLKDMETNLDTIPETYVPVHKYAIRLLKKVIRESEEK